MKEKKETKVRCEGWTLPGSFMTLGPRTWKQCENDAIVMLKVKQDGVVEEQPSCLGCWNKAIERKITILESTPLKGIKNESNNSRVSKYLGHLSR